LTTRSRVFFAMWLMSDTEAALLCALVALGWLAAG
jgi:hypothetical protein